MNRGRDGVSMKPYHWVMLVTLASGLVGCLTPHTTRFPTCRIASPWAERQSLGHHDPLPDRSLGPDTDSRPREFLDGRTQTRQAIEGNLMPNAVPGPVPPGYSSGAYRDSEVVR